MYFQFFERERAVGAGRIRSRLHLLSHTPARIFTCWDLWLSFLLQIVKRHASITKGPLLPARMGVGAVTIQSKSQWWCSAHKYLHSVQMETQS